MSASPKELREAYKQGRRDEDQRRGWYLLEGAEAALEAAARAAYPPKMVERRRTVLIGDYAFSVEPNGDVLRWFNGRGTGNGIAETIFTCAEAQAFADLFAHPTEMVEEDEE